MEIFNQNISSRAQNLWLRLYNRITNILQRNERCVTLLTLMSFLSSWCCFWITASTFYRFYRTQFQTREVSSKIHTHTKQAKIQSEIGFLDKFASDCTWFYTQSEDGRCMRAEILFLQQKLKVSRFKFYQKVYDLVLLRFPMIPRNPAICSHLASWTVSIAVRPPTKPLTSATAQASGKLTRAIKI